MYTLAAISLIVFGGWIAIYWLMAGFAVWGLAAWVATKGGALDTDHLSAAIFTIALFGILAEIFIT